MADYYTDASFVIPCSKEQAQTAVNALSHINGEISANAKFAIIKADNEIFEPEEIIIRHCFFNHPDKDKSNSAKGLEWNYSVETCSEGLWLCSDESINTEQAAIFTQAVLLAFDLPLLIEIEAAHTCNIKRPDAFGGHACVVTKNHIRWHNLQDFLRAERKAHAGSERYFVCQITEINGEYEYTSHFLMKCAKSDNPESLLDDIFLNYRGTGNKERDGFVWFDCDIAAKNPYMSEIAPYEFKLMQAHLNVL